MCVCVCLECSRLPCNFALFPRCLEFILPLRFCFVNIMLWHTMWTEVSRKEPCRSGEASAWNSFSKNCKPPLSPIHCCGLHLNCIARQKRKLLPGRQETRTRESRLRTIRLFAILYALRIVFRLHLNLFGRWIFDDPSTFHKLDMLVYVIHCMETSSDDGSLLSHSVSYWQKRWHIVSNWHAPKYCYRSHWNRSVVGLLGSLFVCRIIIILIETRQASQCRYWYVPI